MKQLTLVCLLFIAIGAQAQINWDNWRLKSPEKEYMFIETHWDYADTAPGDDTENHKDIHYAIEVGIRSNLGRKTFGAEVKVAFEEFPNLYGGFTSYGAGFGPYLVSGGEEQIMYYAGLRAAKVYRTGAGGKAWRGNVGLELKWTYTFDEIFYIGTRFNYDAANDMEIIDRSLSGETRWAVNLTMGWNIRTIGAYRK